MISQASNLSASATVKPRVVFYLPGLYMGGAERHTLDLRQRLEDRGYRAIVLVHDHRVAAGMTDVADEPSVHMLNQSGGMSRLGGWLTSFSAIRDLRPDVLVGVNETMAIRSVLARLLGVTRAKVACTFHTTLMLRHDESRLPLFRLAARALDAMVYVSRNQAEHWGRRGLTARRSVTIVNGVDLLRFPDQSGDRAAAKQRLGLSPDDYVFGVLASFRKEKNHAQVVRALAALRQEGVRAKLVLVGDGVMRPEIEALAKQLGVTGDVVFAGERADVRPVIAAFDVGVICSTQVETFSLAALELLASGVPMIMSDIGGASEIVRDRENGFLFPAGDDVTLVQRLKALSDPQRLALFQSRARASVERFSIDSMMEQYVALIEDLARGRAA